TKPARIRSLYPRNPGEQQKWPAGIDGFHDGDRPRFGDEEVEFVESLPQRQLKGQRPRRAPTLDLASQSAIATACNRDLHASVGAECAFRYTRKRPASFRPADDEDIQAVADLPPPR